MMGVFVRPSCIMCDRQIELAKCLDTLTNEVAKMAVYQGSKEAKGCHEQSMP